MTTLFWILTGILGLMILSRARKIIGIQACPEEENLKDYFEGRLKKQDKAEYDRIISHLGLCEKCQTRLTDLATEQSEGSGENV